jgi:hypothetical protein
MREEVRRNPYILPTVLLLIALVVFSYFFLYKTVLTVVSTEANNINIPANDKYMLNFDIGSATVNNLKNIKIDLHASGKVLYRLKLVTDDNTVYWLVDGQKYIIPCNPILQQIKHNLLYVIETPPSWFSGDTVTVTVLKVITIYPPPYTMEMPKLETVVLAKTTLTFDEMNYEVDWIENQLNIKEYPVKPKELVSPYRLQLKFENVIYAIVPTPIWSEDFEPKIINGQVVEPSVKGLRNEGWIIQPTNTYGKPVPVEYESMFVGVENGVLWTNNYGGGIYIPDVGYIGGQTWMVSAGQMPENGVYQFDINSGYSSDMPEWLIVLFGCANKPNNIMDAIMEGLTGDGVWGLLIQGDYNPERIVAVAIISITQNGVSFNTYNYLSQPIILEQQLWYPPDISNPQTPVNVKIDTHEDMIRVYLNDMLVSQTSKIIPSAGYVATLRGYDYLTYWDNYKIFDPEYITILELPVIENFNYNRENFEVTYSIIASMVGMKGRSKHTIYLDNEIADKILNTHTLTITNYSPYEIKIDNIEVDVTYSERRITRKP